jgi:hypothetical protein
MNKTPLQNPINSKNALKNKDQDGNISSVWSGYSKSGEGKQRG